MFSKSKYGFHPCDYETFLKLKHVHKAFFIAKKKIAEWHRWNNKIPHNRVLRRWVRDPVTKHKISCEIVGTRPEPVVPDIYYDIVKHSNIIIEYNRARHAVPNENAVIPLNIKITQLDEWVAALDTNARAA